MALAKARLGETVTNGTFMLLFACLAWVNIQQGDDDLAEVCLFFAVVFLIRTPI